jgi:hypothetical protein
MINHLTTSGIKNSSYSGPVAQVQLLTGPNRTGKTAISESLRLALTNDAEIGGTPAKQSLLVADAASVHASGGEVECTWTYEGGKRKHLLTYAGMDVKSLQGGLPVTVPEFWALTGDERWGLLEGIVGKFTLPAPQDPAPLKLKVKNLKELPQPEAYSGRPIAEVQAELNEVLTEIARQASIRNSAGETKARNADVLRARESSARSLAEAKQRLIIAGAKADEIAAEHASLNDDIFEWAMSPSTVLEGMGSTVGECLRNLWDSIEPKLKALSEAGSTWACHALHQDLTLSFNEETPVEQCEAAQRVKDKMLSMGFHAMDFSTPSNASTAVSEDSIAIKDGLARVREALDAVQSHYDLAHSTELKPETALDMETYSALIGRRDSLQAVVQSATAWTTWATSQEKAKVQIAELEAELDKLEQHHSAYQSARAAYLSRAIALVEERANAVLSGMDWPVVSVKIDQSGKRNTMTLSAGGVDVAAMSGGEALVYGASVLNAIQEGSNAKCPLMIIEAAELDADNLLAFATAIRSNRTKGNVMIASHVHVDFDGALSL